MLAQATRKWCSAGRAQHYTVGAAMAGELPARERLRRLDVGVKAGSNISYKNNLSYQLLL
jgi:hypothetical protein